MGVEARQRHGSSLVFFADNAEITLSGLSGASVPLSQLSDFTESSFTPSSVVFAQTERFALSGFSTAGLPDFTFGTLIVDSSVLTTGAVDFSMQTTDVTGTIEGMVTGTTQGPVAAVPVPEPAVSCCSGQGCSGWGSHGGNGRANLRPPCRPPERQTANVLMLKVLDQIYVVSPLASTP